MNKCNPLQSENITGKQQADSRRRKPETEQWSFMVDSAWKEVSEVIIIRKRMLGIVRKVIV